MELIPLGRVRSFAAALNGVAIMLETQTNARLHAAATVLVVGAGVALRISSAEWRWLILAIGAVWTAEALNTALEFLVDVASPAYHPTAGNAKEVAAGAVLIAAVAAACVGVAVFGPYLSRLNL